LEGASCNLEVWTIEEHRLTFDHITFDHIDPSGYPGSDLGLEVDIARRTWDASPTYLPPTAPPNITKFLTALLLTWLIEVPVLFVVARTILKPRYTDTKRLLLAGIVASLITLPCAWYVLPFILVVVPVGFYIGTVETLVIVAEAWMYTRFLPLRMKQTLPVSILANVLSFLVGLLLL
jgi:hypothetical protein